MVFCLEYVTAASGVPHLSDLRSFTSKNTSVSWSKPIRSISPCLPLRKFRSRIRTPCYSRNRPAIRSPAFPSDRKFLIHFPLYCSDDRKSDHPFGQESETKCVMKILL